MGWGQTGFGAPKTEWLVYVVITGFNNSFCNKFYENPEKLPLGIVEKTQLCAGSTYSIDDTCPVFIFHYFTEILIFFAFFKGDSGGPIQLNKYYLMADVHGITSFGNACGYKNSPSVYTRVLPYVEWIEEIVWKTVNN